jgi:hypothetical protein
MFSKVRLLSSSCLALLGGSALGCGAPPDTTGPETEIGTIDDALTGSVISLWEPPRNAVKRSLTVCFENGTSTFPD